MKYILLCVSLLLTSFYSMAQTTLRGAVADMRDSSALQGTTVTLCKSSDTSEVAVAITDAKGLYQLGNVAGGNYLLRYGFSGYEIQYKALQVPATLQEMLLEKVYLGLKANDLGNVTVQAAPMQVKGDTTEYTAGMFHTKPNATAEDVLKKLPGVEVSKDGSVTAQGETVQRVLVNGKRFFGDDPKLATQNLPQDVIDKIQVFDDLSDESKATGFDDGNRVKTINITTKKSISSGYFGKVVAAAGNKQLYNTAVNLSKTKGDQQVMVIGQANNINVQNFTMRDILGSGNNRSGGGGMAGGAAAFDVSPNTSGLTRTIAGGINYKDQWGKLTEVSGSYFYNNIRTNTEQNALTENFYAGDSSLFNQQNSSGITQRINNRFNLNIETGFDSANTLTIRPDVSWQQSDNTSSSTTSNTRGKTGAISNAVANTSSNSTGYNGNASVVYRHKFNKVGRTLSLSGNFGATKNDKEGNNYSSSEYFANDSTAIINQRYFSNTNSYNLGGGIAYTEPLSKKSQLQVEYNYSFKQNNADTRTFNYDSLKNAYAIPDSLLTNLYQNNYTNSRATLSYRYKNNNLNFSIGSGVQFSSLTSDNESKHLYLKQNFINLYPTANLNYKINKTTNLRFNYSGRTGQPSVNQLQPVIDNSDPLNISTGNPSLKQSFTNSFRLLYGSFDRVNSKTIFATVNANIVSNNIVNATITNLATGVDTIMPVNMNGAYNMSAMFHYGFPLKNPKSNLNFITRVSGSRSASLLTTIDANAVRNEQENITNSYSFGETIKWTTNLKENFDMNFTASPSYNIARYSIQPLQNANYFSMSLSAEPTYYSKSGWIVAANFNYTMYSGRAAGFNTSVPLLNASVAKQLFANKRGEIKFSINDILNQNISITRTITDNYAKDIQTKTLTRYGLLTFTYNLRSFKQQQQQKQKDMFMPPPPERQGDATPPGDNPGPPPGGADGGAPSGPPPGV